MFPRKRSDREVDFRFVERHVQAGISTWKVLRLATSGAAERLGMSERRGSLAVGKEADIVFLNDNPLEDIENAGEVDTVLQDGRTYRAAELLEMTAAQGN